MDNSTKFLIFAGVVLTAAAAWIWNSTYKVTAPATAPVAPVTPVTIQAVSSAVTAANNAANAPIVMPSAAATLVSAAIPVTATTPVVQNADTPVITNLMLTSIPIAVTSNVSFAGADGNFANYASANFFDAPEKLKY